MTDYLQLAIDKEKEFSQLFSRMDEDTDLVNLARHILMDTEKTPKPIPHAVSLTLNDPAVFATNVEAALGNAEEQVTVTSEDKNLDTALIEGIIKAGFKAADDMRLEKPDEFPLDPFLDQQACRRGRCSVVCIFRIEGGKLVTQLIPWDSRFVTFGQDRKGMAWYSYLTIRSRGDILSDELYKDIKIPDDQKTASVRDIWTRDANEVYIDGTRAFVEPHRYKKPPVIYKTVPVGSMAKDADSKKLYGESIFLLIRDIVPEINRIASLIQSLNQKELDHALQEKVAKEDMDASSPVEHDQLTNPASVVKTTGGFSPMPLGELRSQANILIQMLEQRMQRGGVSNFDAGTFSQAMSAVALIRVGQGRDQVFLPRLGTRGLTKKGLAELMISQILSETDRLGLKTIQIGRQTFDVAPLKAKFDIEFKYMVKDIATDVARQSLAVSQRGLIPDISIRRDTLQREDPDGDQRELYSQEAEILFPNIKRKRILKALAEKAEQGDDDAKQDLKLGLAELGITIDQLFAGQLPETKPPEAPKPQQPMVSLFDQSSRMTQGATNG